MVNTLILNKMVLPVLINSPENDYTWREVGRKFECTLEGHLANFEAFPKKEKEIEVRKYGLSESGIEKFCDGYFSVFPKEYIKYLPQLHVSYYRPWQYPTLIKWFYDDMEPYEMGKKWYFRCQEIIERTIQILKLLEK